MDLKGGHFTCRRSMNSSYGS